MFLRKPYLLPKNDNAPQYNWKITWSNLTKLEKCLLLHAFLIFSKVATMTPLSPHLWRCGDSCYYVGHQCTVLDHILSEKPNFGCFEKCFWVSILWISIKYHNRCYWFEIAILKRIAFIAPKQLISKMKHNCPLTNYLPI